MLVGEVKGLKASRTNSSATSSSSSFETETEVRSVGGGGGGRVDEPDSVCVHVCMRAFSSETKPCLISVPEIQTDQAGSAAREQTGSDEEEET